MRLLELSIAVLLVATVLTGCVDGEADLPANPVAPCGELDTTFTVDERYDPRVRLRTSNGTITMVVYLEQVPVTAGNFLKLVGDGFYDGTRFHQIQPGRFIAGGDPRSTQEERRLWGTGGPGYSIPDEFHQFLRHDQPGIVSMLQAKPNSGGSQFMITMQGAPGLDDHQSVFAKVIDGMDTVREISRTPTDDQGRPKFHAKLHEARILAPPSNASQAPVEMTSYGYDCVTAAEPGGRAELLYAVRNTGQRVVNGTFSTDAHLADGWNVSIRNTERVALPSGQTVTYLVDVEVPADAELGTTRTINLTWSDQASDASTRRQATVHIGELGDDPSRGDTIAIRYVGMLEDGRPFDTTIETYTDDPSLTWFQDPPTHLEPIRIEVGRSGLVEGFEKLVNRAKIGQTVVGTVVPSEAYGTQSYGRTDLGGRLLVFQIDVLPASAAPATSTGTGNQTTGPST